MTARPVVTLHLPMDMASAARILGVTARCFPGAAVTSPDRLTLQIVAEAEDMIPLEEGAYEFVEQSHRTVPAYVRGNLVTPNICVNCRLRIEPDGDGWRHLPPSL